MGLWLRRAMLFLLLAFIAHGGWTTLQIMQSANAAPATPTDVAIILGAAVWRDQPSPVFAARIDYALDLLAAGNVRYLIFTGGLGGGDQLPESIAAARYAIAHGATVDVVRCESISNTTWSNLVAAAAIMQRNQWQSAILVSDPLHLYRARLMTNDLGIDAHLGPTPYTRYRTWNSQIPFHLRELFFVYQYQVQRLLSDSHISPTNVGDGSCSLGNSTLPYPMQIGPSWALQYNYFWRWDLYTSVNL